MSDTEPFALIVLLVAGVGLVATVTMLIAALTQGNIPLALATMPLAGCLLGFLRYNFNPATIFMGDSMESQFKSFIFASAISRTCALVTAPALSRPGSFEPDVSLAAFLMKKDIGGVFISKVNERSA